MVRLVPSVFFRCFSPGNPQNLCEQVDELKKELLKAVATGTQDSVGLVEWFWECGAGVS